MDTALPPAAGLEPSAGMPAAPGALERVKRFYHEREGLCTTAFFVAGFLFDTFFVGRIDRIHNVIHQAVYLMLCAWLTGLEVREHQGEFSPPVKLAAAWRYHEAATHFMLGTLLNIYSLFYFKSASLASSLAFLAFWGALLGVNELRPFKGSATTLRMTLFSLCLVSYFGYLVPMLAHRIGPWIFLASLAASAVVVAALAWRLGRRLPERSEFAWRLTWRPFTFVAGAFAALYFFKLIPPVPLSISDIGVYHGAKREGETYNLYSARSAWRFWEKGDQTFLARPGDKLYCFVSVFSPTRFQEELRLRFYVHDPALGWRPSDAIPLGVTGGRDGGFRTVSVKSNIKPGRWRLLVETSDGRELGRLGFRVIADAGTSPRELRVVRR